MKEQIILAPGINGKELIKSLASSYYSAVLVVWSQTNDGIRT